MFYPERRIAASRMELHAALDEVLDSGELVGGQHKVDFESRFAALSCRDLGVGTGNGLDALEIALRASGVRTGDVVLVPAYTFIATWISVHRMGAVPVGVDVHSDTGLMSIAAAVDRVEELGNVEAIVPVHLYGGAVDIGLLKRRLSTNEIRIVDDCAQAHGHQTLAGLGRSETPDASAYSFYPTKNLGAYGDAGCVLTNSTDVFEAARSLSSYGHGQSKFVYERLGLNSRLDPIQAAFLTVEAPHLGWRNLRRREIADYYLAQSPLVRESTVSPCHSTGMTTSSVWHHFVVAAIDRTRLRHFASSHGVETGEHYPYVAAAQFARLSSLPRLGEDRSTNDFPGSRYLATRATTFPIDPNLTDGEVEQVAGALKMAADAGLLSSHHDEVGVAP